MKKYVFIFLFLLTLLSGCSVENSSDLILNPPTFKLNDIYKGTLELELNEAIIYNGNLTLFVDGKEYLDDTLVLGLGEHVLEAYVWNDSNKSEKVSIAINIIDENNKDFVDFYSEPNINSNIKDIKNINSIKIVEDYDYLYEFINGELISWEKVKLPDHDMGYIIGEFKVGSSNFELRNNIVLRLENDEEIVFSEKSDNYWYIISDDLSQLGYFLINKRNKENRESSSIIVNSKTGMKYETLPDLSFSPSGRKILTRVRSRSYYSAYEYKIQILSIGENEVIFEWTGEFNDFGTGDIFWKDEENIQLTRYISVENEWERVDKKYKEVTEMLTYENKEWKLNRLNSEEKANDNILIYESINEEANVIGSIFENEINNITFKNIYQILNNELILWFEIEITDGKKGYIYRGIRDSESPYYDNKTTEFQFILENGEYFTIADHLENGYDYYLRDGLTEIGYYSMYATYDGEGHHGKFINGQTGESFSGEGFPILSKTKNKFIIANYDFGAGFSWTGIQIFNVNENDITLEYQEGFDDWGPSNVQWIDDSHILFTRNFLDPYNLSLTQVEAEMILAEGSWIIRDLHEE